MFPPQSTLPISLSLEFSVWLLFSLVINDAMPAKRTVKLALERGLDNILLKSNMQIGF